MTLSLKACAAAVFKAKIETIDSVIQALDKMNLEDASAINVVMELKNTLNNKPSKRRPTGYNLFVKTQMIKMRTNHPEIDRGRMKLINTAWKELNDEEKKVYTKKANVDSDEYESDSEFENIQINNDDKEA